MVGTVFFEKDQFMEIDFFCFVYIFLVVITYPLIRGGNYEKGIFRG